jgi:hypothetical protein
LRNAEKNQGPDKGSGKCRLCQSKRRGSHGNFIHPKLKKPITISGGNNEDAKIYQEKAVRSAIEETQK